MVHIFYKLQDLEHRLLRSYWLYLQTYPVVCSYLPISASLPPPTSPVLSITNHLAGILTPAHLAYCSPNEVMHLRGPRVHGQSRVRQGPRGAEDDKAIHDPEYGPGLGFGE